MNQTWEASKFFLISFIPFFFYCIFYGWGSWFLFFLLCIWKYALRIITNYTWAPLYKLYSRNSILNWKPRNKQVNLFFWMNCIKSCWAVHNCPSLEHKAHLGNCYTCVLSGTIVALALITTSDYDLIFPKNSYLHIWPPKTNFLQEPISTNKGCGDHVNNIIDSYLDKWHLIAQNHSKTHTHTQNLFSSHCKHWEY